MKLNEAVQRATGVPPVAVSGGRLTHWCNFFVQFPATTRQHPKDRRDACPTIPKTAGGQFPAASFLLRTTWIFIGIATVLFQAACSRGLPVGNGPAGPAVPREAFARPWTIQPVLLVGLGDSVTAGFGARRGYSYFDRLVKNPPDEFPEMQTLCLASVLPHLTAQNFAVSGSTSLQHEKQIDRLPVQPPDTLGLVVITTGGNDIIHDYGRSAPREGAMFGATRDQAQPWITRFEQRLNSMLDHIQQCFPGGCHIYLANIYDPSDGTGRITTPTISLPPWKDGLSVLAAYNAVIARMTAKRPTVHLVDIHAAFLGHGVACASPQNQFYHKNDPRYWYFENVEDPNERGYDALRRLFLREMAATLGPSGRKD